MTAAAQKRDDFTTTTTRLRAGLIREYSSAHDHAGRGGAAKDVRRGASTAGGTLRIVHDSVAVSDSGNGMPVAVGRVPVVGASVEMVGVGRSETPAPLLLAFAVSLVALGAGLLLGVASLFPQLGALGGWSLALLAAGGLSTYVCLELDAKLRPNAAANDEGVGAT